MNVNIEGTIVNLVTLLAQDAHNKGYCDFEEYLESDENVVQAEVIDADEDKLESERE